MATDIRRRRKKYTQHIPRKWLLELQPCVFQHSLPPPPFACEPLLQPRPHDSCHELLLLLLAQLLQCNPHTLHVVYYTTREGQLKRKLAGETKGARAIHADCDSLTSPHTVITRCFLFLGSGCRTADRREKQLAPRKEGKNSLSAIDQLSKSSRFPGQN
jgi:hypothetical protein